MPDIKLKGYSGTGNEYPDVPKVWLEAPESTEESRVLEPFTYGEAVSKTVEELDFSNGDMSVKIDEGELVTELTVKQPEDLIPENIPMGKFIAGVGPGTHSGGGSLDELLKYFDAHVDPDKKTITIFGIHYDLIYADTGSYDVEIPNQINGLDVILQATLVRGYTTLQNLFDNSYVKNINIGANVKWNGTTMKYAYANCQNFNSPVTIPNGITDIAYVLHNCRNFNQPLTIPNGVTSVTNAFVNCRNINQQVTIPNSVTNISYLFSGWENFNKPIVLPENATNCYYAFNNCRKFNQPVKLPNAANVVYSLFSQCISFNQPVEIPPKVTNTGYMFSNCWQFNSPVNIPNTVQTTYYMFYNCQNFNQPITITEGTNAIPGMLMNCKNMAQDVVITARNITNVWKFLNGTNTLKRINIFVPAGSNTNTWFAQTSSSYSVLGSAISWITDSANNCRYNSQHNIYVYWV